MSLDVLCAEGTVPPWQGTEGPHHPALGSLLRFNTKVQVGEYALMGRVGAELVWYFLKFSSRSNSPFLLVAVGH